MKTDFSVAAKAVDIIVSPGSNTVTLQAKAMQITDK
jgi:hypothetical protein